MEETVVWDLGDGRKAWIGIDSMALNYKTIKISGYSDDLVYVDELDDKGNELHGKDTLSEEYSDFFKPITLEIYDPIFDWSFRVKCVFDNNGIWRITPMLQAWDAPDWATSGEYIHDPESLDGENIYTEIYRMSVPDTVEIKHLEADED